MCDFFRFQLREIKKAEKETIHIWLHAKENGETRGCVRPNTTPPINLILFKSNPSTFRRKLQSDAKKTPVRPQWDWN